MRKRNCWSSRRADRVETGRARGKASQRVQRAKRQTRDIEPDTLRWRTHDDARGTVLRHGCTYMTAATIPWQIVRSRAGRANQLDVLVNGSLWRTCGPRRLPAWLRP